MKHIFSLLGALVIAFSLSAQHNSHSNYLGINAGGGLNTFSLSTNDNIKGESWKPALGFNAELRYSHFFGRHLGFGVGVAYMQSSAILGLDGEISREAQVHPEDGLNYDLITTARGWEERQTLGNLSIPIELLWRAEMGEKWGFLFGVGVEAVLPMSGKFVADKGSITTDGYYPSTGVTYPGNLVHGHGFDEYKADYEGDIETSTFAKVGVNVIADLGFNYQLANNWGLYFGFYGTYGLLNHLDATGNQTLVNLSGNPATLYYPGLWASDALDEAHLFSVGAKVGINFGWDCSANSNWENEPEVVSYDNNADAQPEQNAVDAEAAAAAAAAEAEARCNAQRMNSPELATALSNIEQDVAIAEKAASESGNSKAQAAVANAQAAAIDARTAHKNGQFCKAYDLMSSAYSSLAHSYAYCANECVARTQNAAAKQAADDAALYADAANKGDLEGAMASMQNAKLNMETACSAGKEKEATEPYLDPNFADRLAQEAIAMANQTGSKSALTDGNDASGKAYRGDVNGCYGAAAHSFAKSAEACAANSNSAEAQAALKDARRYADEASHAARMGNTGDAYRAAILAHEAAVRACSSAADNKQPAEPAEKPLDKKKLQGLLDQINATVHFDFAQHEPIIDAQTNKAIDALCNAMSKDSSIKVLITGHADNVGTAERNVMHGQKRAQALKDIMVKRGAPAASISIQSKGDTDPVADNDTDEHRYLNRRAVITLR